MKGSNSNKARPQRRIVPLLGVQRPLGGQGGGDGVGRDGEGGAQAVAGGAEDGAVVRGDGLAEQRVVARHRRPHRRRCGSQRAVLPSRSV